MTVSSLIVEDDPVIRASVLTSLRRRGFEVRAVGTIAEALRCVDEWKVDLVLADIRLPDGSGLQVLDAVTRLDGETVVIVMTSFPEVQTAIDAMKRGASEYLMKPFELEELHLLIDKALEHRGLRRDVKRLSREQQSRLGVAELIGESPSMRTLAESVRKVAVVETPVLVVGETGTGKEVVADVIHRLSPRSGGPMVKVNCSTFSEQLLDSELFGHEKGAFTDARETQIGLFEMSDSGTLFLDEIAEMRPGLQAKLLRVLEGQPFRRLGGRREIRTSVRVIAATHQDLPARVRSGAFREDLYFRLNVFQIQVPPVRDRGRDIILLARHFLECSSRIMRKGELRLSAAAEEVLLHYPWPGNVRELKNVLERATIVCETGSVGAEHLPGELHAEGFLRRQVVLGPGVMPPLVEIERRYIEYVLGSVSGNLSEAARILGVARNTLKSRLRLATDDKPEA